MRAGPGGGLCREQGGQGRRGAENLRPGRGRGAQQKRRGHTSYPIRYKLCAAWKPEGI